MKGRRVFVGGALASLGLLAACQCGEAGRDPVLVVRNVDYYVVRHAEKVVAGPIAEGAGMSDPGKDPALTKQGQMRALALPKSLPLTDLRAIYSTPFKRTRQTVEAVAAVTGLEINEVGPKDTAGLVEKLKTHRSGAVLVSGHSNTVPAILKGLGVEEPIEIADDEYGDLFVVRVPPDGKAKLDRRRYGD